MLVCFVAQLFEGLVGSNTFGLQGASVRPGAVDDDSLPARPRSPAAKLAAMAPQGTCQKAVEPVFGVPRAGRAIREGVPPHGLCGILRRRRRGRGKRERADAERRARSVFSLFLPPVAARANPAAVDDASSPSPVSRAESGDEADVDTLSATPPFSWKRPRAWYGTPPGSPTSSAPPSCSSTEPFPPDVCPLTDKTGESVRHFLVRREAIWLQSSTSPSPWSSSPVSLGSPSTPRATPPATTSFRPLPSRKAHFRGMTSEQLMVKYATLPDVSHGGPARGPLLSWPTPFSEVESFASQAISAGTVTGEVMTRALSLAMASIPWSGKRKALLPPGKDSVQRAVYGLYAQGVLRGVTRRTRENPWLVRLLTALATRAHPDFSFTTVQINMNYATLPHVDRNNIGRSAIIAFGTYEGGDLWVADESGDIPLKLDADVTSGQRPRYKAGATYLGKTWDLHETWHFFNGSALHYTTPFTGLRFSLVYFTPKSFEASNHSLKVTLGKCGFPVAWTRHGNSRRPSRRVPPLPVAVAPVAAAAEAPGSSAAAAAAAARPLPAAVPSPASAAVPNEAAGGSAERPYRRRLWPYGSSLAATQFG